MQQIHGYTPLPIGGRSSHNILIQKFSCYSEFPILKGPAIWQRSSVLRQLPMESVTKGWSSFNILKQ